MTQDDAFWIAGAAARKKQDRFGMVALARQSQASE